jgi:hypothetical protein
MGLWPPKKMKIVVPTASGFTAGLSAEGATPSQPRLADRAAGWSRGLGSGW